MSNVVIETKKLRKVFGPIEAVKGVSFRVGKGEVLGFLGPNGAGKSTVMRMLTCFLTPTSGTASVGGYDILEKPMDVRRLIGYLPETNPSYGEMTVVAFLSFIGEMRGLRGAELKKRLDAIMEQCAIASVRDQVIETLSKGYKRRVGLAQTFIHNPPILILDEPTDGLDPNQKHEVRSLIHRMAPDKAIIISTHILEEVDAICTRAIIIADGRIVADGTPDELRQRSRYHGAVRLSLAANGQPIEEGAFKALPNVADVEAIESTDAIKRFMIFPKEGKQASQDVMSLVRQKGWKLEEISVESGRLDEVFRQITAKEGKRS